MPELPEIDAYLAALGPRLLGQPLVALRLGTPFVLRTVRPLDDLPGRRFCALRRLGKRVVLGLDGDVSLVLHLMLAGRLQWQKAGAAVGSNGRLLALDVPHGALVLTEAGSKRRASLHVVDGDAGLAALDAGGLELLDLDGADGASAFRARLRQPPGRTLKRALSEPWRFAGVGGAWGDEICWAARLSPFARAQQLDDATADALLAAARQVLAVARARRIAEAQRSWPAKVTAFDPAMAVHGKHRQPCPRCGATIQRVVAAGRETNYCPPCQTGGRVLADRMLSQLLREDWRGDPPLAALEPDG